MTRNPKLKVTLILDYYRSSRGGKTNSFSYIEPILRHFGSDRVTVLCYKNPLSERIGKSLPMNSKFSEILGVHHMKYLVFDEDVILTG